MKTPMKPKRRSRALLLSIACAGVAAFLGGCAEGPYVATYDTGYPTAYYTGYTYDYYGPYTTYPAYDRTVVRSGTRYNDAYGARYYGSSTYGDWY